ncbi:MAG: hypothetical protein IK103_07435 [Bacteroidales bacterium]|nr:hypothetical protein [Bacteroidales bacterium]
MAKVRYWKKVPFMGKDFIAINLFGFIVVRKGAFFSDSSLNHEMIHSAQQREMLFVFFYIWYVLEWLIRLLCCFSARKAYFRISFEKEAYANEYDEEYLKRRKLYNWVRYLWGDGAR